MSVPGSNGIPLTAPTGAFDVDSVTDLRGNVLRNIIDVDQGFEIHGRVQLPSWLSGNGHVCIYAEELGGHFNKRLHCVEVCITKDPCCPPCLKTYPWTVNFPVDDDIFPDPQPGDSQLYRFGAVFTFGEQTTDIQSFVDMGMYLVD